jgi:hypothetical protein
MTPDQRVDHARIRAGYVALGAAWAGTSAWLDGLGRIPRHTSGPVARDLRARLFGEGLRFVQLPFKQAWAQSQTRLLLVEERGLDAAFASIGGQEVLRVIRAAHAEFGEALGVTEVPEPPAPPRRVREALLAFTEALRMFVVRVIASVDRRDGDAALLAQKLLGPIERCESAQLRKRKANADQAAEADASRTAPGETGAAGGRRGDVA